MGNRYLRGEQITIRVGTGDESKGYQLPKGLLCSRSTWFSNALKDERFQEAQTGVMHLPDDPTRAFDHFVLFLYKHALEFDQICPLDNEAFAEACAAQLLECFQTWTFGDKVTSPSPSGVTLTLNRLVVVSTISLIYRTASCIERAISSSKRGPPNAR